MNDDISSSEKTDISNLSERHPDVQTALRDMTGHACEAYALLDVYRTCQDDSAMVHLATENLRRYTQTWERLENLLLVHGVPSLPGGAQ